ncbi:MAG: glycosyl transferase family 1 [Hydrogenophilales bacterium 28-61-23]|nr:MAG: glycosyl transferase family 1 [Hydrogenophilales bacterium 28-61-23]
MRIVLITPYLPVARNGNAHTAARWDRFLRQAGHGVAMSVAWDETPADLMIALHARRSHAAIARFSALYPERPLLLVLTGTDIYRDIHRDADAQASLALAHCIVALQEQGPLELPEALRPKARVIYQSSPRLKPAKRPVRTFDVCVVAHLRDEKDPFRTAFAARLLPAQSRIRVHHIGGALQIGMAEQAQTLAVEIPRWRWLGALAHGETRRRIARSHLLVLSSRMEGGANVICEAVMAGTPVLASRIPGNVGMLGVDYAGYFPLGDEAALAELMLRAESDAAFYRLLAEQCAARAYLFEPALEAASVQALARECR